MRDIGFKPANIRLKRKLSAITRGRQHLQSLALIEGLDQARLKELRQRS
jgi:hypothetical protein